MVAQNAAPVNAAPNPYRSQARLFTDDFLRAEIHQAQWLLRRLDDLSDADRQMLRWQLEAAQDELAYRWRCGLTHPDCDFGFDRAAVQRIKTRWPLEAVIGQDVDLKRVGQGYRGRCPIHNGRNDTSLYVKPGRDGFFHCFGCNVGGDAIAWIMATQHVEFSDALRLLSILVGEPLPMRRRPERKQRVRRVVYR